MADTPAPKLGRPPRYTPEQLEKARVAAAEERPFPRFLNSPKAQQDYLWEITATQVLSEWQQEDLVERQLPWWQQYPRPHSALAELGRLGNADLIIAVALLIEKTKPAGKKEAARGIQAFRLQLGKSREAAATRRSSSSGA